MIIESLKNSLVNKFMQYHINEKNRHKQQTFNYLKCKLVWITELLKFYKQVRSSKQTFRPQCS